MFKDWRYYVEYNRSPEGTGCGGIMFGSSPFRWLAVREVKKAMREDKTAFRGYVEDEFGHEVFVLEK